MFGIISPCFTHLDETEQSSYQAIYCNLCAALSRTFGLHARPLVINDVVALDWLLNGNNCSDHLYKCGNCLKGGTLLKTNAPLSKRQQFLAAISAYTIAVKLADSVQDEPSLKIKLAHRMYGKIAEQAKTLLKDLDFDYQQLETMLLQQKQIESERITALDIASYPTSYGYGMVAAKIAELGGNTELTLAKEVGEYIGRYVFIIDAIKDIKEDLVTHSYNPFIAEDVHNEELLTKNSLTRALPFLLEQQQHLFAKLLNTSSRIEKKWVFINKHLKEYLQKFVEQSKELHLFKQLLQFEGVGCNAKIFKRIQGPFPIPGICCPGCPELECEKDLPEGCQGGGGGGEGGGKKKGCCCRGCCGGEGSNPHKTPMGF